MTAMTEGEIVGVSKRGWNLTLCNRRNAMRLSLEIPVVIRRSFWVRMVRQKPLNRTARIPFERPFGILDATFLHCGEISRYGDRIPACGYYAPKRLNKLSISPPRNSHKGRDLRILCRIEGVTNLSPFEWGNFDSRGSRAYAASFLLRDCLLCGRPGASRRRPSRIQRKGFYHDQYPTTHRIATPYLANCQ